LHIFFVPLELSLEDIDSKQVKNICKIPRQMKNKKGGEGGALGGHGPVTSLTLPVMFFMSSQSGGTAWLPHSSSLLPLCGGGGLFSANAQN
jgi:hypothetical protein